MTKIAIIGDICLDKYPKENITFLGGCAFNFSYHLKKFGADFVLFAPLGQDRFTEKIEIKLRNLEIEVLLGKSKLPNQSIEIVLNNFKDRSFLNFQSEILDHSFSPDLSNFELIIAPYFKEIRQIIKPYITSKKNIALDLGEAENLSELDLQHLASLSVYLNISGEKFSHELLTKISYDCFVSITLAGLGARVYKDGLMLESYRPQEIFIRDTTGAGDSFFSYVAIHLNSDIDQQTLINSAVSYAQSTLMHLGATPVIITV